jgi:hypothetical protein
VFVTWCKLIESDKQFLYSNTVKITEVSMCSACSNTVKVKNKVMLRLMVSQSVCLGVKITLELVTRYYFLSESCCVVSVGRLLWREVGSVSCQSLSSVFSPLSKIQNNLHCTCFKYMQNILDLSSRSRSHITTDGQSASSSWFLAPFGSSDQTLLLLSDNYFLYFSCRAPSLMRERVCNLQCNDASSISSYIATDGRSCN